MSTQDPAAGYAFWTSPDGSARVTYSLPLFGDIDSLVGDGYRRIPHGGIESGGLLFGVKSASSIRIEAFRPIQCQHAFGPSFVLSEKDLDLLREQIVSAASDPDLAGLTPVGLFIGHTRTALEINDREAGWFDEFFPEPGSLLLLVKPERFQPTRFAFHVRDHSGTVLRNSSGTAFILPLSSQAARTSDQPAASVSAPLLRDKPPLEPRPSPPPSHFPPSPAFAMRQPTGESTRVRTAGTLPVNSPPSDAVITPIVPSSIPRRPDLANNNQPDLAYPYASLTSRRARPNDQGQRSLGVKSAAVLVLAAFLGCIAGYWAYLRLPSPVIPVSVREQRSQLVVEWPAASTSNTDFAALKVNDGDWLALTSAQKNAGQAVVAAPPGDVKIDLIAKHWLRDSRGIVRYVRTGRPAYP